MLTKNSHLSSGASIIGEFSFSNLCVSQDKVVLKKSRDAVQMKCVWKSHMGVLFCFPAFCIIRDLVSKGLK